MGYSTRFSGSLTVEPPLSWPEIQRSPSWPGHPSHNDRGFRRDFYGAYLHITEKSVNTDDGLLIRRRCDLVTIEGSELRSDAVLNSLRRLAADFGADHEFIGTLDADGEESGDVWRVRIVGQEVIEDHPVMLWPGDVPAMKIVAATLLYHVGSEGDDTDRTKLAERVLKDLAHGLRPKGR